jgi:hypothetical protein
MTPEQKRNNRRMAFALATLAMALFVGFIAKSALFGI